MSTPRICNSVKHNRALSIATIKCFFNTSFAFGTKADCNAHTCNKNSRKALVITDIASIFDRNCINLILLQTTHIPIQILQHVLLQWHVPSCS